MATQPAAQTVTLADMPRVYTATVDGKQWWKFTIPSQTRTVYVSASMTFRTTFLLFWTVGDNAIHDGTIPTTYATDGTTYPQFTRTMSDSSSTEQRAFPIHLNPTGRNIHRKDVETTSFFIGASTDQCLSVCFGGM